MGRAASAKLSGNFSTATKNGFTISNSLEQGIDLSVEVITVSLTASRNKLNELLNKHDGADFQEAARKNWSGVETLIKAWWKAYKDWEQNIDKFNDASGQNRMTMRTFPANFEEQKSKKFDTINVTEKRFFSDSKYTTQELGVRKQQSMLFHGDTQKQHFQANRGIDSSAFANPANFATRLKKYEAGLHDLSASLFNSSFSLFEQIHNNEQGAFFSFLPLSQEDDQVVLFNLIRSAKKLKAEVSQLHELVRSYRAEMTRVKLAANFDMGVGYIAIHAPTETGQGSQFKLRYGLGNTTTVLGGSALNPLKVTPDVYEARQQSAIRFTGILNRQAKNEIVIAIRKHAGDFPVYGVRVDDVVECFTIVGGNIVKNGKTIGSNGKMT